MEILHLDHKVEVPLVSSQVDIDIELHLFFGLLAWIQILHFGGKYTLFTQSEFTQFTTRSIHNVVLLTQCRSIHN